MAKARVEVDLILKEIREIKRELVYIKEHMVDVDTILTDEEVMMLKEAEKEFEQGRTTRLDDLKKE